MINLFSDYLNNPTEHRFNFSVINESDVLTTIEKLKNKNSSGVDEISNKLLKAIGIWNGTFQAANNNYKSMSTN